jgi:hypothetical protein
LTGTASGPTTLGPPDAPSEDRGIKRAPGYNLPGTEGERERTEAAPWRTWLADGRIHWTIAVLGGLSGTDVLAALRRAGLAVPVILISGHPITEPEGFEIEAVAAAVDRGRSVGA